MSIQAQRIQGIERGAPFTITVDGQPVEAYAGESIATALLAAGYRAFRKTDARTSPRGLFCGMGICFECRVTVDGLTNQRACMTQARDGCEVWTT